MHQVIAAVTASRREEWRHEAVDVNHLQGGSDTWPWADKINIATLLVYGDPCTEGVHETVLLATNVRYGSLRGPLKFKTV